MQSISVIEYGTIFNNGNQPYQRVILENPHMTMNDLDGIAASFMEFHAPFAHCFDRKELRQHCEDYTRGLIVQSQDRCNAENLADVVPASPRVLQRFLTESRWSDQLLMCRLQSVMAPRLQHPEATLVVDESGFIKQGKKSAGVARQYSGTAGKVGNCQVGVFLAYVSPEARLLIDKDLLLPETWCSDAARCAEAGIPEQERKYRSKPEIALDQLRRVKAWGHLNASWVAGDDHYGQSPLFRRGLEKEGFHYVLDVPKVTPVLPLEVEWQTLPRKLRGRAPKAHPVPGQKRTAEQRAQALPPDAWCQITLGQGAQGPRCYLFARERVHESLDDKPGPETWLVHRRNLDGTEPRYYLSNGGIEVPLEKLASVAGSRWRIETEFEETKGHVGLDEYEVRGWHGWHHHIALCLLANAFLLTVQQDLKKKLSADYPAASLPSRARTITQKALLT
jgi:SRSO17 transposase